MSLSHVNGAGLIPPPHFSSSSSTTRGVTGKGGGGKGDAAKGGKGDAAKERKAKEEEEIQMKYGAVVEACAGFIADLTVQQRACGQLQMEALNCEIALRKPGADMEALTHALCQLSGQIERLKVAHAHTHTYTYTHTLRHTHTHTHICVVSVEWVD